MIRQRSDRNLRHLRRLLRRDALRLRQRRHRRNAWRRRIAGKLEHVSHRPALHAGIRPPRPLGIFVAAPPAIIGGIGVNDHARRAMFLRDENFDSAKILPVAHQHDLAAHVDFQLVEFLEIFRRAVVGIDHVGLGIARRRHAVERHHHAGIVLIRIVVDMLARGAVHFDSGGRGQIDADFCGIVHPDFVFDDFGVEPGVAEFLRNIIGGCFVFDGAGHVRSLASECADALPRAWDRARPGSAIPSPTRRRRRESQRWLESNRKMPRYRLQLETILKRIGRKTERRLREVSWAPVVKGSKVAHEQSGFTSGTVMKGKSSAQAGSGVHDVSVNHDRYLAEFTHARKLAGPEATLPIPSP